MANRTNRTWIGAAIGVVPGVLLWIVGIIVGGEAMLSFGVIGIFLAVIGAVVGAIVGAGMSDPSTDWPAIAGAMIGAVPGLVMIFGPTMPAFPVILIGALFGWSLGRRLGHHGPTSTAK